MDHRDFYDKIIKLLRKPNCGRSSVAFCNPDYYSVSP